MFITLFYVILFGLAIGSFLNVVIYRLHENKSIVHGRSFCPCCQHTLSFFDLIPVFSFIFLRGKCRYCQKKISWQYPAVELATAILFALAYLNYFHLSGFPRSYNLLYLSVGQLFADLFFLSVLLVVFVYDLKHYLILDMVVLPAAALALATNLLLGMAWQSLLLGAAVASGFFLLQYAISRGKWIGFGDVKLGLLLGFLLGWPQILVCLFLAYILGGLVGLGLIFSGRKGIKSELPFGTFLSVAAVVTMLWGDQILNWYLRAIGF